MAGAQAGHRHRRRRRDRGASRRSRALRRRPGRPSCGVAGMINVDAPASPGHSLTALDVANAAQLACLLEASAPKPGNVSPGRHFADARYEHFLASAAAIGPAFADASSRSLGETILSAARATSQWTRSNTNLGIVLLLAPIARAASVPRAEVGGEPGPLPVGDLRANLGRVLGQTTVADAKDVFTAIRLAAP